MAVSALKSPKQFPGTSDGPSRALKKLQWKSSVRRGVATPVQRSLIAIHEAMSKRMRKDVVLQVMSTGRKFKSESQSDVSDFEEEEINEEAPECLDDDFDVDVMTSLSGKAGIFGFVHLLCDVGLKVAQETGDIEATMLIANVRTAATSTQQTFSHLYNECGAFQSLHESDLAVSLATKQRVAADQVEHLREQVELASTVSADAFDSLHGACGIRKQFAELAGHVGLNLLALKFGLEVEPGEWMDKAAQIFKGMSRVGLGDVEVVGDAPTEESDGHLEANVIDPLRGHPPNEDSSLTTSNPIDSPPPCGSASEGLTDLLTARENLSAGEERISAIADPLPSTDSFTLEEASPQIADPLPSTASPQSQSHSNLSIRPQSSSSASSCVSVTITPAWSAARNLPKSDDGWPVPANVRTQHGRFNLSFLDQAYDPKLKLESWTVESVLENRHRLCVGAPLLKPVVPEKPDIKPPLPNPLKPSTPFGGPTLFSDIGQRQLATALDSKPIGFGGLRNLWTKPRIPERTRPRKNAPSALKFNRVVPSKEACKGKFENDGRSTFASWRLVWQPQLFRVPTRQPHL